MTTFTIGCDPEFFVRDEKGNPISAHELIKGSKEEPLKVKDGAVQVDGLALEINTNPVEVDLRSSAHKAAAFEEFNRRIVSVLAELKGMLPKGYTFDIVPSRQFDKEYYDSLPDDCKILGCDPDFNAWKDGEMNPRPEGDSGLRGAAGHVHIGWGSDIPKDHPEHMEICSYLVRNLDRSLGVGMLTIDPDIERRKVYGRAGAFRPKSYGVEYRTPSNVWIRTKNNRRFMWNMLTRALTVLGGGREIVEYIHDPATGNTISSERLINENMREWARLQASSIAAGTFTVPPLVDNLAHLRAKKMRSTHSIDTMEGDGE